MESLQAFGRLLIVMGLLLAILGVLLVLAGRFPFIGRLPGISSTSAGTSPSTSR
jgi:hypothetical protein